MSYLKVASFHLDNRVLLFFQCEGKKVNPHGGPLIWAGIQIVGFYLGESFYMLCSIISSMVAIVMAISLRDIESRRDETSKCKKAITINLFDVNILSCSPEYS